MKRYKAIDTPDNYTERFHRLRKEMGGSWKDIEEITGLKSPGATIRRSENFPRWAILAIIVFENLWQEQRCIMCHEPKDRCICTLEL